MEHNVSFKPKLIQFMLKTGCQIVQQNGQRKFGPPFDWTGPPPPRGCEVFVAKIPRDIFEDELVPVFSETGKIYEMRLMMEFSGFNRGYAFVTYSNKSEADAAIKRLNGYEITPGHKLVVVKSIDNCNLLIGCIPKTKTREDTIEELTSKGVSGIVDVIMYKDNFNENLNRGYAIVKFNSHNAAAMARRYLIPEHVKLWGVEVTVDWADPEIDAEQIGKHDENKKDESSTEDEECAGAREEASLTSFNMSGNYCLPQDDHLPPTAKLEAICKRYMWMPPRYSYNKYIDPVLGIDLWVCSVELPQVGQPLWSTNFRIGPFVTRACYDIQQAQQEAAQMVLSNIFAPVTPTFPHTINNAFNCLNNPGYLMQPCMSHPWSTMWTGYD